MKFYGNGTVWDNENQRALCTFDKKGELITEDKHVIRTLNELDFKYDEEGPEITLELTEDHGKNEEPPIKAEVSEWKERPALVKGSTSKGTSKGKR